MIGKLTLRTLVFLMNVCAFSQENHDLKLWYAEPATNWMTQALPVGNGYIGAMFFGSELSARCSCQRMLTLRLLKNRFHFLR